MTIGNLPIGSYHQLSASANVQASSGALLGIFVSSASNTPTITVYDSVATTTTTKIIDTFIPTVGWFPMPLAFQNGCYVVITGTVSCTAIATQ